MAHRKWASSLAFYYVTPYIPLLLTPIPFSATLEIMSIFLLVLVVIIPTVKGAWNAFSDTRILEVFGGSEYCNEHKDICIPHVRKFITFSAFSAFVHGITKLSLISSIQGFLALAPVLLLCALCIIITIASYFAERSNRKTFIQKKQVQVSEYAFTEHSTQRSCTC